MQIAPTANQWNRNLYYSDQLSPDGNSYVDIDSSSEAAPDAANPPTSSAIGDADAAPAASSDDSEPEGYQEPGPE